MLLSCSSSESQSARHVVQKAFASVVLLATEDANGQPRAIASGFFVRPNVIATNAHAIEGAASGYVKIVGQRDRHQVTGIVGLDTAHDLALLSVGPTRHGVLALADSRAVQVGDEVFAVGNPQGLEGTVSQGIVSGIRRIGEDFVLQITAPISPGSSGGPVLNGNAEVIGIATATFQNGQNLNFAIPSTYLQILIENRTAPVPLARRTSVAQPPSILRSLGTRSVEGVLAEAFAWDAGFQRPLMGSGYTFTLRNRLQHPVSGIRCLVLFIGQSGKPVDFALVRYEKVVPPGLAKRITATDEVIEGGERFGISSTPIPLQVDESVRRLARSVQIHVLDFKLGE